MGCSRSCGFCLGFLSFSLVSHVAAVMIMHKWAMGCHAHAIRRRHKYEPDHCTLQAETVTSQELSKVLIEMVGEDLIKEWQMLHRAGRVQVISFAVSNSLKYLPSLMLASSCMHTLASHSHTES